MHASTLIDNAGDHCIIDRSVEKVARLSGAGSCCEMVAASEPQFLLSEVLRSNRGNCVPAAVKIV